LYCILRHCSVQQVRFIPQDLYALPANFLRSRLKIDFLQSCQIYKQNNKKADCVRKFHLSHNCTSDIFDLLPAGAPRFSGNGDSASAPADDIDVCRCYLDAVSQH
jgi:hypothetical protein